MLLIPIALPVSLIVCLVSVLVLVFYSCPMSIEFDLYVQPFIQSTENSCIRSVCIVLFTTFFIFPYAASMSFLLLVLTSLYIHYFTIIMRLENIPVLTFVVLSTFYCSRFYCSLTRKYDDLAANLYKFLKIRVQQDDNQQALNLEYNKKKAVPKFLFKRVCQKVMPLGENIGKFLVNVLVIVFFFSLVLTNVTETPSNPDHLGMKITATFLVAVMPMVFEIVVLKKGDKMEELEQEELDEKIRSIVDEYYNSLQLAVDDCPNQNRLREETRLSDERVLGEIIEPHGSPVEARPSKHYSGSRNNRVAPV